MLTYQKYAIIVSGGSGLRMESELPKQFLEINGLPVLMHSISAFYEKTNSINIVLILSEVHHQAWENLCKKHEFKIPHKIVYGGETRFHSVRNGLKYIFDKEPLLEKTLIAIHDGVRPLIKQTLIFQTYKIAEEKGTAVPAINSKDSIRILTKDGANKSINRNCILLIQTPQTFKANLLKEAYKQQFEENFTDDSSVIEKYGYPIHILEGDIRNIKITYPTDLILAEMLMNNPA